MDSLFEFLETNSDEIEPSVNPVQSKGDENSNANHKTAAACSPSIFVNQTSVSEIKGIRIIKNQRSLASVEEKISSYEYHSAQKLVSLSRGGINLLTASSKSGKTNISTIAIVFRNSGTKLSKSNGSAFSILSVGGLSCGPIISLFLFGEAYSKFSSKTLTPGGTVLAIIEPSILPSKPGSEHAMTLAVYDQSQIVVIGTAQDYGICQHVAKEKRCKNYVDLRKGKLCAFHVKCSQPKKSSSNYTSTKAVLKNLSFVQKIRLEAPNRQPKSMSKAANLPNRSFRSNPYSARSNAGVATSLADQLKIRSRKQSNDHDYPNLDLNFDRKFTSSVNSNINLSCGQIPNRNKRDSYSYNNRQSSIFAKTNIMPKPNVVAKQLNVTQRRANDYSNLDGYDGQVFIPKPSPFLSRAPIKTSIENENMSNKKVAVDNILNKQRQLASKIKIDNAKNQKSALNIRWKKKKINETGGKSFSTVFEGHDIEAIASRKSIFSNELEAEQYAKSRQIVNGLEKKEDFFDGKKRPDDKSLIERVWICGTCDRTFRKKPIDCIRATHRVKLSRTVKQGVENKKCKKDAIMKEKGLILGKGLEWDKRYVD